MRKFLLNLPLLPQVSIWNTSIDSLVQSQLKMTWIIHILCCLDNMVFIVRRSYHPMWDNNISQLTRFLSASHLTPEQLAGSIMGTAVSMRNLNSWLPNTSTELEVSYFKKHCHKTEKQLFQEESDSYARKRFVIITWINQILYSFVLEQIELILLLWSEVYLKNCILVSWTENKKAKMNLFHKDWLKKIIR